MISRQLDRITLQQHIAIDEVAQALALTYLAYYNTEAMQPRVLEAYKRAWAFNTLQQFPRTVGGTPGFNVCMWNVDGIKHMHIAIEGTTNYAQLLPHTGVGAWHVIAGLATGVITLFHTHAANILTQLQADAVIGPKLLDSRWVITCAGHSLGAACADILAFKIKQLSANQRVRLIKFASPRVGNALYHTARDRVITMRSIYCSRDPIFLFPTTGTGGLVGRVLFPALVPCNPLGDAMVFGIRRDRPTYAAGYNTAVREYPITYVRQLAAGFPERSPWYDHLMKSYRLAMLALCSQQRDMLQYRFRYLEHNDENQWQTAWGPGVDTFAGLDALPLGVDTIVEPITGEVEEQTITLRPRQQAIVPGDQPLDNPPMAPEFAPVGFPATPPATTATLPRRRFVRPRPPR